MAELLKLPHRQIEELYTVQDCWDEWNQKQNELELATLNAQLKTDP